MLESQQRNLSSAEPAADPPQHRMGGIDSRRILERLVAEERTTCSRAEPRRRAGSTPGRPRRRASQRFSARGSSRHPRARIARRAGPCDRPPPESKPSEILHAPSTLSLLLAAASAGAVVPDIARAADPLKIGLIMPKTGPSASTGKQVEAACRLYMAKNGDTAGGRKVELLVKDDSGAARATSRIAQELVVATRCRSSPASA